MVRLYSLQCHGIWPNITEWTHFCLYWCVVDGTWGLSGLPRCLSVAWPSDAHSAKYGCLIYPM